jgi:eukaryotic-like serine/threonine-protein kinase
MRGDGSGEHCPGCVLRLGLTPALDEEPVDPPAVGPYRLLEVIGEGGFGTVWLATQTQPFTREVALKVIKPGIDCPRVQARFSVEKRALAMMDHPHIARVLDGGQTDAGRPYFVMELARGPTLLRYCESNRLPIQQRLALFLPLCEALQHAHQKGVIHRDIKPSNILVCDRDGVPVPKIIDFGVAKATRDELAEETLVTHLGQIIGTPAYMSPEQASLGGIDVDTRSDIYSLGVLLYEALTGRIPFSPSNSGPAGVQQLLHEIREVDPKSPSSAVASLPAADQRAIASARSTEPSKLVHSLMGDLDRVVLKCLEKERSRRYPSAAALAEDLRRFLRREPVTATAPTLAYRFGKFANRHWAALLTAVLFLVVLMAATAVSVSQAIRAGRLAASETQLRRIAQTNELHLRRTIYAADVNLASQALDREDTEGARNILHPYQKVTANQDVRGWEWHLLWKLAQGSPTRGLFGHSNAVPGLAWSLDGTLLWSCGQDGSVRSWNPETGEETARYDFGPNPLQALALHPSGERIAVVSPARNLGGILDVRTGRAQVVPIELSHACWVVVAAPDGSAFLHGSGGWGFAATNGVTVIRDLDFASPRLIPESGARCAFTRDGSLLATGTWGQHIKLWHWPSLLPAGELGPVGPIGSLAFSSDGERLVAGASAGELTLWHIPSRSVFHRRQAHAGTVISSAQFSPDGTRILTSAGD